MFDRIKQYKYYVFGLLLGVGFIYYYYYLFLFGEYSTLKPSTRFTLRSLIPTVNNSGLSSSFQSSTVSLYHRTWMVPRIDINAHSVLVFLHIQKTTGSLIERRLMKDGLWKPRVVCANYTRHCRSRNSNGFVWLVSRYSTGWICGIHADWTEYSECIDAKLDVLDGAKRNRTYYYFTMLRDPIDRYLSEWQHVQRGATWRGATLRCKHHSPTFYINHPCYVNKNQNDGFHSNWFGVSLDTFINCSYNLASNRQTRMLANLSSLGCYKHVKDWSQPLPISSNQTIPQIHYSLLASAEHNLLANIHCFGLSEYLVYAQYMFQKCLNITFKRQLYDFLRNRTPANAKTHAQLIRSNGSLQKSQSDLITSINYLDLLVYRFAKRLFLYRLVYRLLSDARLPNYLKRPMSTLWFKFPKAFSALHYLLYEGDWDSSASFTMRLHYYLARSFLRQNSLLLPSSEFTKEKQKFDRKLYADFN